MTETRKAKTTIGRAEIVRFPELGNSVLHARIDTGARTSSIWATDIVETEAGLRVRFASPEYQIHDHPVIFEKYDRVRVASSMGHEQLRYKVQMPIVICGRRIKASFTLSDRSTQVYPVLIGRLTLTGKFIVDVSRGEALEELENARSAELQADLGEGDI